MTNDDILNNLPSLSNPYNPNIMDPNSPQSESLNDSQSAYADRPGSSFQNDLNQSVRTSSNLMGPSNPDDPENDALSSRARQIYGSNVNTVIQNASPMAKSRQMGLQAQAMQNKSAIFSTAQSRATLNYQQVSYQRQFAIQQEQASRALMMSIFQGVGTGAGYGAGALVNYSQNQGSQPSSAAGMNSGYAQPTNYGYSGGGSPSGGSSDGSYTYGGATPTGYNSPNFGQIGGN